MSSTVFAIPQQRLTPRIKQALSEQVDYAEYYTDAFRRQCIKVDTRESDVVAEVLDNLLVPFSVHEGEN